MSDSAKVLLIEDEDAIREIYKSELELAGFQVDDFGIAKEGLAAFKNNDYDAVVLDIILTDMNGLDVLKQMKQVEGKKETPILLLTTVSQDIVIKKGLELGATAYLHKDHITPDQLAKEIKEIL